MKKNPSHQNFTLVIGAISAVNTIVLYSIPLNFFYTIPFYPISPALIQLVRTFFLFTALIILLEKLFYMKIYTKILLGLALGGLAGLLFQTGIVEIKPVGTAFIRLIQMIVIPLVFSSLLVGTASLSDPKKMGRIGLKTLVYYLVYTAFAIILGLTLANLFQPGRGLPEHVQKRLLEDYSGQTGIEIFQAEKRTGPIETVMNIIPTNPMEALGQGKILQIIFFAIFTGIALALVPKNKASPVLGFFQGINDAMIQIVHIVIKIAPYGVFALIASVVGSFGLDILYSLFKYTAITILGMIILNFTYPPVVKLFTGMNPGTFMKGILSPQLVAFSTSSSSATLPVTIEACEENLGVPNDIASFVLPLGATVNMNGTALYQGISALFIAQVYNIPLDIGDQLIIVLTATLAAIGTAGAPGIGILMLVIVLQQVGIPPEGIALIFGVERILDMFRTTLNITGDASAAVIIAASEGELRPPNTKKYHGEI